jgi:hypothetical protein
LFEKAGARRCAIGRSGRCGRIEIYTHDAH